MSSTHPLSLETVRKLAVVKQGLHQRPATADRQALLESIHRIGLLQLDTVSVVARSHYLVILSRVGLYNPEDLDALLYPDRHLFQQWAHAACLIPVKDYEYFAPVIHARRGNSHWSLRRVGENPQAVLDEVMAEIKKRGPLASKDFKDSSSDKRSWWNWKPAKAALDVLHTQGYLMIDRRVKFQMYYDLAERVLPASVNTPGKTIDDWNRWAAHQSIKHLGVATAKHASDYYRQKISETQEKLQSLAQEGTIVPIEVEGWKETTYVHADDRTLIEEIENGAHQPKLTTFLSPFDNLTWNRKRLLELFGFEFSIEMYIPKVKRKYGYYLMPILHNGRFIGRIDPKADRKTNTLIIQAMYLEPGEDVNEELLEGLTKAIEEFMAFHGSEKLVIKHTEPNTLQQALQTRINS